MNARHVQLLSLALVFGGLAGVGAAAGVTLSIRVMGAAVQCSTVFSSNETCLAGFRYLNQVLLVLLGAGAVSLLSGALGLRYTKPTPEAS